MIFAISKPKIIFKKQSGAREHIFKPLWDEQRSSWRKAQWLKYFYFQQGRMKIRN